MVSLWGGKKNGVAEAPPPQDDHSSSRPRSSDVSRQDPDERTHLLPHGRPQGHGPYLDPDDDRVSPLNLWSVRFTYHLIVVFTLVTFVWATLNLISTFVTVPGFQSRGGGYTTFSFNCLTLGNLLVALIFFAGPAQIMRISYGAIAVLLLTDVILVAALPEIRVQEGWVGLISVIWAFVMAFWCVLSDRIVEWGKHEEEERLTGRPETRRTLKEWIGVLTGSVILLVELVICVLLTATLILRAIDNGLEPDGSLHLVDGGKYSIHLNCVGNRKNLTDASQGFSPTVMLESGEQPAEQDFVKWANKAYEDGVIDRFCYWDRPGYAFSQNAPSPHSAGMSADALSEVLSQVGEEGPLISVSAGYGSVVARIFASRRRDQVVGIMMIDPLHEDLLYRVAKPGYGFKLWGRGILSPLGIDQIAGALFKGRTKEDRVYGQSTWQTSNFLKAKLQENLVAESLSKSDAQIARQIQSVDTPLVVVSSGIKSRRDVEWEEAQRNLANYTKNVVAFDIVKHAGHEVWKKHGSILQKRLGDLVEAAKGNVG